MQDTLKKSVTKVLKPLVRLLLRHGISQAEFADWTRQAYVDEARAHFGVDGKPPTLSRIAVVTGINRKEVKRLLETADSPETQPARQNRAARVVAAWMRDEEFLGSDGLPKPLSLGTPEQGFNWLVKKHSGDVPVRAVLDELVRTGTVKRSDDDTVTLASQGYVPFASEEAMLNLFGESASDLLKTIEHNLINDPSDSRLQLSVVYDNVSGNDVMEFKTLSREGVMALLKELDRYLASRDRDTSSHENDETQTDRYRTGLGIYFIQDKVDDSADTHN